MPCPRARHFVPIVVYVNKHLKQIQWQLGEVDEHLVNTLTWLDS